MLKSESYVPESGWSLCGIHVTRESIKGMLGAAGFHLGPGINAATRGKKENRHHVVLMWQILCGGFFLNGAIH